MPQAPRTPPAKHAVLPLSELPPGSRKILEVEGKSVGLFNVHGTLVAALNVCPHQLAPVCLGRVGGTTLPSAPGEFRGTRSGPRSTRSPGSWGSTRS